MEYINFIVGIMSALIGVGTGIYKFVISKMLIKKPFEKLLESLEKGHSIILPEELKYQIKCYVQQKFVNNGKVLSLKGVEKKIWKLEGNLYAITGKPASGKTVAIRKLYCEMAKRKKRIKCIFFNMNRITKDEDLRDYLSDLIIINRLEKNNEVIAFFDGVDEAISFIGNEKFDSLFLQGVKSEIFNFFREKELDLRGIVLGLRTEFIEGAENELKRVGNDGERKNCTKSGNYYMEVFRMKEMTKKDALKVYKSLKVLKALDKKLPNEDKRRHQHKYPEFGERRKYLKFLDKILDDKNSIFYYPMYIRYAYIYMKEYEKDWNPYRGDILMLSNNMVSAIGILIEAIIKWEFHIYDAAYYKNSQLEKKTFSYNMHQCLCDIIEVMANKDIRKISREQLKKILNNHCLNFADAIEKVMPVFSHCLMMSDGDGEEFEFVHFTFYEYFLAKYLIEKADSGKREQYLVSDNMTLYFLHMYYEFLFKDKIGNEKSLGNIYDFNLTDFIDKKSVVKVIDRPKFPMSEIHNYLPFIKEYIYRGQAYTQIQLEEIRESKILDITNTGWDSLEYAKGIVYPECVEKLDLRGLPIKDISALKEYVNLKWLDVRISLESTVCTEEILTIIRGCSLHWICINTNDGIVCERLNDMVNKNELYIEKIYANIPNYSEAHMRIYQLKQVEQKVKFYICTRSDWSKARLEYKKSNDKKDPDLLKAVFELEADEDGILGLKGKGAEPTIWNGLSLAEYFLYCDCLDEDRGALSICNKLEPNIPMNDSRLSFYFGRTFGKVLHMSCEYDKAKQWFLNTWKYSEKYLKEELQEKEKIRSEVMNIGLDLYRVYARCKDEKIGEFGKELLIMIKENENYEESSNYLFYLKISIGYSLENWKKGEYAPQGLMQKIQDSYRIAEIYTNKNKEYYYLFCMLYFSILYANRIENLGEVTQLLDKIQDIIQKDNLDETNRSKQAIRIMYWEQKIYYLFLKGDKEETIKVIDELIDYPYRNHDKDLNAYLYIREACLQNLEENIDKHRLWGRTWY